MIDPLSLTSLAITIVGICNGVVNYLNIIHLADPILNVLGTEVSQLSGILLSLSKHFNNPIERRRVLSGKSSHSEEYWQHVKRSMTDCRRTLEDLRCVLRDLEYDPAGGLFSHFRKGNKLKRQAKQIDTYRQQISAYKDTMNLALQLIAVYFPSVHSEALLTCEFRFTGHIVSSQLDELTSEVKTTLRLIRRDSQASEDMLLFPAVEPDEEPGEPFVQEKQIRHLWDLGRKEFELENYQFAKEFLNEAYKNSGSRGRRLTGWEESMSMFIISLCKVEQFDAAEEMVITALKTKVQIEAITLVVEDRMFELADTLIATYRQEKEWQRAINVLTEVLSIRRHHGVSPDDSERSLAETYFRMGNNERAKEICKPLADRAQGLQDPPRILKEALLLMVLICFANGERAMAERYKAALSDDYKCIVL